MKTLKSSPRLFLLALLTMMSIGAGGCLYAALAPMALTAAQDVGSGTLHAAETVASSAHSDISPGYHPGEDETEREDRCAHLPLQTPGVIELRTDASGAPEYRELRLYASSNGAQWMPVTSKDTSSDGWRPAVNFLKMSFSPPLTDAMTDSNKSYLAYAPSEPVSAEENDQNSALVTSFGIPKGSFNWDGRAYKYSVTRELPCYPPPSPQK